MLVMSYLVAIRLRVLDMRMRLGLSAHKKSQFSATRNVLSQSTSAAAFLGLRISKTFFEEEQVAQLSGQEEDYLRVQAEYAAKGNRTWQ